MKLINRNGRTESQIEGKDYLTTEGQFSSDPNKHYLTSGGRTEGKVEGSTPTPNEPEEPEEENYYGIVISGLNEGSRELLMSIVNSDTSLIAENSTINTLRFNSGTPVGVHVAFVTGEVAEGLRLREGDRMVPDAFEVDPNKIYGYVAWNGTPTSAYWIREVTGVRSSDNWVLEFDVTDKPIGGCTHGAKVIYSWGEWFQWSSVSNLVGVESRYGCIRISDTEMQSECYSNGTPHEKTQTASYEIAQENVLLSIN